MSNKSRKQVPNAGVVSIAENHKSISPTDAINSIEEILTRFEPEMQNNIITELIKHNVLRRWNENNTTGNNYKRASHALDSFIKLHPGSEDFIKEEEKKSQL